MLRVRKVIQYLCDKLSFVPHPACIGSNYSGSSENIKDGPKLASEPKKVYIELYCQGKVPFIEKCYRLIRLSCSIFVKL